MICHHYKCLFIHIPKNAGQSIEHVFLNLLGLTWETRAPLLLRHNKRPELGPPKLAHLKAVEYVRCMYLTQEMFDEYFKFSIVRNPWDRMVSMYRYLGIHKKCDFKTFLQGSISDTMSNEENWFIQPQSKFLYSQEGELLVDYIGRFETVQNDFDIVCNQLGIPIAKIPFVNQSKENDSLKAKDRDAPIKKKYQDYYDQKSVDLVARFYKSDIDLFKYDFA